MKSTSLIILCLCFFQLVGQNTYKLEGQIRNADGISAANAEVLLVEEDTLIYSKRDGSFLFNDLVNGKYTLRIFSPGFQNQVHSIQIENKSLSLNFDLSPIQNSIAAIEIRAKTEFRT